MLIDTCHGWWLKWVPALSGKEEELDSFTSSLPLFLFLYLPQMFIPPVTSQTLCLPKDAQINEKNEPCDPTTSSRVVERASVGMCQIREVDRLEVVQSSWRGWREGFGFAKEIIIEVCPGMWIVVQKFPKQTHAGGHPPHTHTQA